MPSLAELYHAAINEPRSIAGLTDYDGTMANIVGAPMTAKPDAAAREAFLTLQSLDPTAIAIITGRARDALNIIFNLDAADVIHPATVAGQHGAEVVIAGEKVALEILSAEEKAWLEAQKKAAKEFAEKLITDYKLADHGISLDALYEEKEFSFAFHTRLLKEMLTAKEADLVAADIELDSLIAEFEEQFTKKLSELSASSPKFALDDDASGAAAAAVEHPSFHAEMPAMTFELKPHKAKVNKGKVAATLLAHPLFAEKKIVFWAGDDLKNTDGDVAAMFRTTEFKTSRRQAFVIQVLRTGAEQKVYDAENYGADFDAARAPDVIFESPAEYGKFLLNIAKIRLAREKGASVEDILAAPASFEIDMADELLTEIGAMATAASSLKAAAVSSAKAGIFRTGGGSAAAEQIVLEIDKDADVRAGEGAKSGAGH